MREEYGPIAYGFIPFRHGDPMVNLETKHGADERVLVDDLVFQVIIALGVAREIGLLEHAAAPSSAARPDPAAPADRGRTPRRPTASSAEVAGIPRLPSSPGRTATT